MIPLLLLVSMSLALPASAADVRMAFGDNLPPFILVRSSSGIEVDIVREALAYRGHVLKPVFMPMGRLPVTFVAGTADAIMMDVGHDMTPSGGWYGDAPVVYDNAMLTLARRQLSLKKPADLNKLWIMSFVGAATRYPGWLGWLEHTAFYVERNNQAAQPKLLALGRYDVVISDRTIFAHYVSVQQKADPAFRMPAVDAHALPAADPRAYRPVFRAAAVRDDFNAGLAWLRQSGRYDAIYQRYLALD